MTGAVAGRLLGRGSARQSRGEGLGRRGDAQELENGARGVLERWYELAGGNTGGGEDEGSAAVLGPDLENG